jgi:hypothetical protein
MIKLENKYFLGMYGIIAMLVIIAFIFYFNAGNRSLLFGSIVAFLVFLSAHLSYKYTGSLQSALRNSIFIAVVVCAFVYLIIVDVIGQKSSIMGAIFGTYLAFFFSFLILSPPLIADHLNKLSIIKRILALILPLVAILTITIILSIIDTIY